MEKINELFDSIIREEEESERLVLINELRSEVDDLIGENVSQQEQMQELEQDKQKWMDKSYDLFHQLGDQNQNLNNQQQIPQQEVRLSPDTIGKYFE